MEKERETEDKKKQHETKKHHDIDSTDSNGIE